MGGGRETPRCQLIMGSIVGMDGLCTPKINSIREAQVHPNAKVNGAEQNLNFYLKA